MVRLIGILTGSAIAVAVLIITLGVPALTPADESDELPEAMPQAEVVPAMPEPAQSEVTASAAGPEPLPPVADADLEPVAIETHPDEPPIETFPAAQLDDAVLENAPPTLQQNWYAFWSPFRSRIAADGFVSELQRTTGLDYRVVKLKPGVYEVAFAYSSDAEIEDKLEAISTATGLDMSGG